MKYYPHDCDKMHIPTATLFEQIYKINKDYLQETALLYQDIQISFGEMFLNIDMIAKSLVAAGVKRNDIVTIALPNIPELIYLFFAVNRIGAVANMIHPNSGQTEISKYVNNTDSKLLFIYDKQYKNLQQTLNDMKVCKSVVVSPAWSLSKVKRLIYNVKNHIPFIKNGDKVCRWSWFEKLDWAAISYTGGTTGEPKGVVLTNKNCITESTIVEVGRKFERQECMMSVLPAFVMYSLANTIIEPLLHGFKTLLIPNYQPAKLLKYIKYYHVNHTNSIPAYWNVLLEMDNPTKYDLASLGFLGCGGEQLNPDAEIRINQILASCGSKVKLIKGTGMTELTSAATASPPELNDPPGSVGIPLPLINCKILNVDSGSELTYNQEGEICFSGPTIMAEYYKNPDATAAIIEMDDEGIRWIHTGDIGYMTTDGIIYVTGRIKRLIMHKDENGVVSKVFPERIEAAIKQHKSVCECCVVGIPDKQHISLLKAFVELNKGYESSKSLINQILQSASLILPSYMIPKDVEVVKKIPLTDRGKVDYHLMDSISSPDGKLS